MCSPDTSATVVEDATTSAVAHERCGRGVSRAVLGPSLKVRRDHRPGCRRGAQQRAVQKERRAEHGERAAHCEPDVRLSVKDSSTASARPKPTVSVPAVRQRSFRDCASTGARCALERQRIGLGSGHDASLDHRDPLAMLHLAERAPVRHRQPQHRDAAKIINEKTIRITVLPTLLPPRPSSACLRRGH